MIVDSTITFLNVIKSNLFPTSTPHWCVYIHMLCVVDLVEQKQWGKKMGKLWFWISGQVRIA